MSLKFINPKSLGEPRGYSNGVLTDGGGRWLFIAGQIGWDENQKIVSPDLVQQFDRALTNVVAVVTEAGGKPERNRDIEFVILPGTTRNEMVAYWETGWKRAFDAIEPLQPEDLMRTVRIRGQDHTVVQAINRQLTHYAYHVGQIVYLAKHFRSSEWQSLSVPKNKSAEFNARMSVRSPRVSKG